jgi:hypothetical protein
MLDESTSPAWSRCPVGRSTGEELELDKDGDGAKVEAEALFVVGTDGGMAAVGLLFAVPAQAMARSTANSIQIRRIDFFILIFLSNKSPYANMNKQSYFTHTAWKGNAPKVTFV